MRGTKVAERIELDAHSEVCHKDFNVISFTLTWYFYSKCTNIYDGFITRIKQGVLYIHKLVMTQLFFHKEISRGNTDIHHTTVLNPTVL